MFLSHHVPSRQTLKSNQACPNAADLAGELLRAAIVGHAEAIAENLRCHEARNQAIAEILYAAFAGEAQERPPAR